MSQAGVVRPKALSLTVLVDWSNQERAEAKAGEGVGSSCHPCWMCVHFGPPPSAMPHAQQHHAQMAGQWQLTLNIYSAEKTPIVKKQNEEPIPKERRALLWYATQPFDKYRYAVVMQHCRFPAALTPRVVAFHADRAEPDANALVWVKKKTSMKRHKEDSYMKVVKGHIYHLHITFPDGALVNQFIAQGWGFTASLFTYKRKRGHINVSPSRAVTQIRANWLDVVEPDPDVDELEAARLAKVKDERDDQQAMAEEKSMKGENAGGGTTPDGASGKKTIAKCPAPHTSVVMSPSGSSSASSQLSPGVMTPGGSSSASSHFSTGLTGAFESTHLYTEQTATGATNGAIGAGGGGAGSAMAPQNAVTGYIGLAGGASAAGSIHSPLAATVGGASNGSAVSSAPHSPPPPYYQQPMFSPTPLVPGQQPSGHTVTGQPMYIVPPNAAAAAAAAAAATAAAEAANAAAALSTMDGAQPEGQPRRKRAMDYSIEDLNNAVFAPGSTGNELPEIIELKALEPNVDMSSEVDAFFDTPAAPTPLPPVHTTAMERTATGLHPAQLQQNAATAPAAMSTADRELLSLTRALEQKAKSVATDANSKLREAAVRLTQVLSASGQLPGWKHVEWFLTDADMYSRMQRATEKSAAAGRALRAKTPAVNALVTNAQPAADANKDAAGAGGTPKTEPVRVPAEMPVMPKTKIDELYDRSVDIIKVMMTRARWVLEVEKKNAGKQSDGKTLERVLGVLLKDQKWMKETASFLKNAEQQVSTLINMNPAAFAKFRELQARGVQWPHSPHLRRHIERAGFVFRPMMIKRDRCVCDACGVEVSGWRPWHNPWLFHDWTQRHPFAPPPGTLTRNTTAMDATQ